MEQEDYDYIHFFAKTSLELAKAFPDLKNALAKTGMLWLSWPKRSSGMQTDLDENRVMQIGLNGGLVDIKVAAIDETWSGLKFVYRLKDR